MHSYMYYAVGCVVHNLNMRRVDRSRSYMFYHVARAYNSVIARSNPGVAHVAYQPDRTVNSNLRILENPPELRAWSVDPKTGQRMAEEVWNNRQRLTGLADVMRVRGARKQTAARIVRPIESIDTRENPVYEHVDSVNELGEVVSSKKVLVGWERERRDHAIFQGYRGSNFKTGEKFAGGQREVKRVQAERDATTVVAPVEQDDKARELAELKAAIAKIEAFLRK